MHHGRYDRVPVYVHEYVFTTGLVMLLTVVSNLRRTGCRASLHCSTYPSELLLPLTHVQKRAHTREGGHEYVAIQLTLNRGGRVCSVQLVLSAVNGAIIPRLLLL